MHTCEKAMNARSNKFMNFRKLLLTILTSGEMLYTLSFRFITFNLVSSFIRKKVAQN